MLDSLTQVQVLDAYTQAKKSTKPLRAFIKIDQGGASVPLHY